MSQRNILYWLAQKERATPRAVFRMTDISKGCGMDSGNCCKAVDKLVKYDLVEQINKPDASKRRYRIKETAYNNITGEGML